MEAVKVVADNIHTPKSIVDIARLCLISSEFCYMYYCNNNNSNKKTVRSLALRILIKFVKPETKVTWDLSQKHKLT